MPLAAHGVTHPGRRTSNEDAMLVDLAIGLFVVADGMGGHRAGEIASDLAVQTIRRSLLNGSAADADLLETAVRRANEQILRAASLQPDYAGMGTTVVAMLIRDDRPTVMNVGDSRAYQWAGGSLSQLTRDDSWIAATLDAGASAEDVRSHPMRHVLTKVVGVQPDLDVATSGCDLAVGDVLLLCSDGLHGSVPDTAIARELASGRPVEEIADRLVEEALSRGATDNVTAVVIRRT